MLSEKEFADIKYYVEHDSGLNENDLRNLVDTIEAQQKEIEQLKKIIKDKSNIVQSYSGIADRLIKAKNTQSNEIQILKNALSLLERDMEQLKAQNTAQKELLEAFRHVQACYADGIYIRCPECEVEIYYEDWSHVWDQHDENCIVGKMIREAIGGGSDENN